MYPLPISPPLSPAGLFGEMEGNLAKNGVWGYFDIVNNGVWNKEGCATTPTICKALEEAGLGVVGKTYISLFYPQSSTWPHTASSNTLLSLVINLLGDTEMRIGDKEMKLTGQDSFIIDPSFEQEVSNESKHSVAMYIVAQLNHPEL